MVGGPFGGVPGRLKAIRGGHIRGGPQTLEDTLVRTCQFIIIVDEKLSKLFDFVNKHMDGMDGTASRTHTLTFWTTSTLAVVER